jgi:hypothetical protein
MQKRVQIENIEDLRRRQGIEDVELDEGIRQLKPGGFVRITLVTERGSAETLWVRVTSIKGAMLRGKLASRPASAGLCRLHHGASIAFRTAHIHSIPKGRPPHEQ